MKCALIPAQYVKHYVKTNKSDYLDAEAIAEAMGQPIMRFVPIKTDDQLDLQALHRVRDRLVHHHNTVINELRGFFLERGIVFAKGPANLRNQMSSLLQDANQNITPRIRKFFNHLWQEWKILDCDIELGSQDIEAIARR